MKYRWHNGKAQAIAYVPVLGKCVPIEEETLKYKWRNGTKQTIAYVPALNRYENIIEDVEEV